MRVLHTADWHLGARLVERDRLPEHAAFFDWLLATLPEAGIDALLVSGDVFDAANPPQEAVALYFDLLKRLADLRDVRVIITGGNHDSASHLNAPRELLRRFDIHVFGHAGAADTTVDLGDALVCAVPFLRERDLRLAGAAETAGTAQDQVRTAIRNHYASQRTAAQSQAQGRPVLAMGHLTVLGASTSDSERDVHIGNLGAVGADVFSGFDYTALGHLHRPQKVAGQETVRYSGSPLALSFSEAADAKSVAVYDTQTRQVETLPVPLTRALVRCQSSLAQLAENLAALPAGCWAEVTVTLESPEPALDRLVREQAGARLEVLKVLAELPSAAPASWQSAAPALSDLQPREVFAELLRERQIADETLVSTFDELLALHEAAVTQ